MPSLTFRHVVYSCAHNDLPLRVALVCEQVTVSRVHICLIDNSSVPDKSFTVGLYLGELKLLSVRSEDSAAHVAESSGLGFMKRASMKDLAIYINTTDKLPDQHTALARSAAAAADGGGGGGGGSPAGDGQSSSSVSPLIGATKEQIQSILLARMDPTRTDCSYIIRPTGFDMSLVFNGNASPTVPQMQVRTT